MQFFFYRKITQRKRKQMLSGDALKQALTETFPSILVSASILWSAGFCLYLPQAIQLFLNWAFCLAGNASVVAVGSLFPFRRYCDFLIG